MTDVSTGSKRSWDGADSEHNKRARDRDQTHPRDWRDVHLKSPTRDSHSRKSSYDRRDSRDRRGDDSRRRGHNDQRRRDSSHYSKDRGRDSRHDSHSRHHPVPPQENSDKEDGEISPPRHSQQTQPATPILTSAPAAAPPAPEPKPLPDMELDILLSPPPIEETLAQRRAKRQAILAKYSQQNSANNSNGGTPGLSSAVQPPNSTIASVSDLVSQTKNASLDVSGTSSTAHSRNSLKHSGNASPSASSTPVDFALAKQPNNDSNNIQVAGEQISAADYDPSLDRREDEARLLRDKRNAPDTTVIHVDIEEEEEEYEEDDDVDDMFAVASAPSKKIRKVKKKIASVPAPNLPHLANGAGVDSAADEEGYYSIILGEHLDEGKYQVFSSIGKGMFANVVRARVLQGELGEIGKEVAIKVVRCQESMYRAGLKEVQILNKLRQADPDDKKHIVRLERTFEHRGHLCMVFESLSMNLRDVVKRFGKDVGLNIRAVRAYANQLFLALTLLRKSNIMHADIKPDNILVNEHKTVLKLCDLGSASDVSENDITPYLVSRFYRAPEIILGVPYDPSLDIWSIGCTLYELYTGKILFPGRSNNQMLLLMMELKGRFSGKMIKKAKFGDVYFDEMGGFESVDMDRITGAPVARKVHISKPVRDLRARLMPSGSAKLSDEENMLVTSFVDLLEKCLALDPARRITPKEALTHAFIRG